MEYTQAERLIVALEQISKQLEIVAKNVEVGFAELEWKLAVLLEKGLP